MTATGPQIVAPKLAYSPKEAAEATGISKNTIYAAIKQTYATVKEAEMKRLPRLRAKAPTNGRDYRILATDLLAWLDQLPDA